MEALVFVLPSVRGAAEPWCLCRGMESSGARMDRRWAAGRVHNTRVCGARVSLATAPPHTHALAQESLGPGSRKRCFLSCSYRDECAGGGGGLWGSVWEETEGGAFSVRGEPAGSRRGSGRVGSDRAFGRRCGSAGSSEGCVRVFLGDPGPARGPWGESRGNDLPGVPRGPEPR